MAKQLIKVKASSRKYKKYEKLLNKYLKAHDAEFQKVLLSAWTDLMLYGTTVIDFDKSYGGTD